MEAVPVAATGAPHVHQLANRVWSMVAEVVVWMMADALAVPRHLRLHLRLRLRLAVIVRRTWTS